MSSALHLPTTQVKRAETTGVNTRQRMNLRQRASLMTNLKKRSVQQSQANPYTGMPALATKDNTLLSIGTATATQNMAKQHLLKFNQT